MQLNRFRISEWLGSSVLALGFLALSLMAVSRIQAQEAVPQSAPVTITDVRQGPHQDLGFAIGYAPQGSQFSLNYRATPWLELSLFAQGQGSSEYSAYSLGLGAGYLMQISEWLNFRPVALNAHYYHLSNPNQSSHGIEVPIANIELKYDRISFVVGPRIFNGDHARAMGNAFYGEFRFAF